MGIWQAAMVFFLSGVAWLPAAAPGKGFEWNSPVVVRSLFTADLGMLDTEREEYATNLASLAANQVVTANASPQSLVDARRHLALALHLSPRNKRAIVVNFQLAKGVLPEVTAGHYSAQAFARLLLSRGQLLKNQGGAENQRLAQLFVYLAAVMDPKNEDAVFASEVNRLDHGALDWSAITDGSLKTP
ncbi:MAG: hypothetical protein RLZZ282_665 [Verrucomicrobiota bacterium]|jgi:hypothetical protein